MGDLSDTGFGTRAIRVGQDPHQWSSYAVIPPIVPTTTYLQAKPGVAQDYAYSRCQNPTRNCLEKALASVEECAFALAFSSGMGAISGVISMLRPQDHIIATKYIYGGTREYLKSHCEQMGIRLDFVVPEPGSIKAVLNKNTKMVWLEGLSNPLLRVSDVAGVSSILNDYPEAVLVVANTFLTPYFSKPLKLGADIVVHSATKYINGHSDVTMGILAVDSPPLYKKLQHIQLIAGAVPSPIDCFLVNRGLKTLHVRMDRHMANALAVAEFLESHPLVKKVYYPGLKSHPDHELWLKTATGCGGMISFVLDCNLDELKIFVKSLRIFSLATSLGGVESLIQVTPLMTYALVEETANQVPEVDEEYIRLSVGIETKDDLIQDLRQALEVVKKHKMDTKSVVIDHLAKNVANCFN